MNCYVQVNQIARQPRHVPFYEKSFWMWSNGQIYKNIKPFQNVTDFYVCFKIPHLGLTWETFLLIVA